MNIRAAEIEDLEAIVDIYNQAVAAGQRTADTTSVSATAKKEWFSDHKPDKHPIFIAEQNGVIIGYSTISPYRPGRMALRHTAEVSYYVNFKYHRMGVASRLMEHAIDRCPLLQIKTLFAILIENNDGSIGLLEKYGFEKWGHLPLVADFDGIEIGQVYYGLRIEKNT